jgi:hypothetical protein
VDLRYLQVRHGSRNYWWWLQEVSCCCCCCSCYYFSPPSLILRLISFVVLRVKIVCLTIEYDGVAIRVRLQAVGSASVSLVVLFTLSLTHSLSLSTMSLCACFSTTTTMTKNTCSFGSFITKEHSLHTAAILLHAALSVGFLESKAMSLQRCLPSIWVGSCAACWQRNAHNRSQARPPNPFECRSVIHPQTTNHSHQIDARPLVHSSLSLCLLVCL